MGGDDIGSQPLHFGDTRSHDRGGPVAQPGGGGRGTGADVGDDPLAIGQKLIPVRLIGVVVHAQNRPAGLVERVVGLVGVVEVTPALVAPIRELLGPAGVAGPTGDAVVLAHEPRGTAVTVHEVEDLAVLVGRDHL